MENSVNITVRAEKIDNNQFWGEIIFTNKNNKTSVINCSVFDNSQTDKEIETQLGNINKAEILLSKELPNSFTKKQKEFGKLLLSMLGNTIRQSKIVSKPTQSNIYFCIDNESFNLIFSKQS